MSASYPTRFDAAERSGRVMGMVIAISSLRRYVGDRSVGREWFVGPESVQSREDMPVQEIG